MRSNKQSVLTAAEYYDDRHARGWMDSWPESKRSRVVNIIQESGPGSSGRILEYGCGVGVFADALKKAVPSFEVHGCDISPTAVARARERCPNVSFHLLSDDETGPPLEYYDLVYTHHVLEHVQDLSETLERISSLLKPNGKVIHIVPCANADSLEFRISKLTGNHGQVAGCFCCDDSSHVRRMTSEELADKCLQFGLIKRKAQFANQFWGGIDYLTGEYHRTLLGWLNPRRGVTAAAKLKLFTMMVFLVGLLLLRNGPRYVLGTANEKKGVLKRCLWLLAAPLAILMYPLSLLVEKVIQRMRDREWNLSSQEPHGSEMYILFEKQ